MRKILEDSGLFTTNYGTQPYNRLVVNALTPLAVIMLAVLTAGTALGAQNSGTATPAVPRPFPGAAPPSPGTGKPADPVAAPVADPAPAAPPSPSDAALAGAPVYPTADFLESFDAGRGQRYYLYGTNTPYADIVAYYRNVLKSGGRELYRSPPMQQFDLGRFQESAMAYPPSVVVKDYAWNGSAGYLFISGTTQKRYRTIIQIVPSTGAP